MLSESSGMTSNRQVQRWEQSLIGQLQCGTLTKTRRASARAPRARYNPIAIVVVSGADDTLQMYPSGPHFGFPLTTKCVVHYHVNRNWLFRSPTPGGPRVGAGADAFDFLFGTEYLFENLT